MLYLLIICIVWCGVVVWSKAKELLYEVDYHTEKDLYIKLRHHIYLAITLLVLFIISAVVGTIFTSCSDFLSVTTEESSNTYQVTDFSAEKSAYNLIGDYETKYSITIEDNYLIEISTTDSGVEVICNNYNPTTVTFEEKHYFKWWFLFPCDTFTYTLL